MSSYSRRRGTNSGIAQKAPVRCATTANIVLSGFQTIDGVTPTTNQHPRLLRVLVKDQTSASQNGIYEMSTGTWQRTADFNSTDDFSKGTRVGVTDGATQVSEWVVTSTINPDSFQWDVDSITFADALTVDYSGALSAIDIGVTVQAWDADLDQFAALAPTNNSFLVGDGTDWTLESGATARATLGLTIGTHVQAWDAQLDLWAAETPADYYDTAAVDAAINAAAAAVLADLASNLNGEGAGLVGIYDAAGYYTGTTVEAALQEAGAGFAAHLADTADAHDASAISIVDAGGYYTGTQVEAALQEIGAAAYLSNVVEDATPQLGGDLDLNSSDITGTGNIDIAGSVTLAGDINIDDNTIIYDDDTQGTIFRLADGTQWTWHDATGTADRMILDRATGALDVASVETTGNVVIGGSVAITGADPVITLTDTDTTAINRISANNATGSLRLYADLAAAVANSRLYLNVDGADQLELSSTVAAFAVDVSVPDEAYHATNWNGSLEVPTKNAVRDEMETKLASASYTAADVLSKLLTVDGSGSGLDADLLDGNSSAFFAPATVSGTAAAILASLLTVDGAGSGLDADLLDGISSAAFSEEATSLYSVSTLETRETTGGAVAAGMKGNGIYDGFSALTYVDVAGATNLDSGTAGELKPALSSGAQAGLDTMANINLNSAGGGFDGWNVIQVMPASSLTRNGTKVRLLLGGPTTGVSVIDGIRIGHQAAAGDAWDAETSPTSLTVVTVGGNPTFTLNTNDSTWTDWITFALDETKALLVKVHFTGTSSLRFGSATGHVGYGKAGATEVATADVAGYASLGANLQWLVAQVQIASPQDLDVKSTAITLSAAPSWVELYAFVAPDTATLNTDLIFSATRNNAAYQTLTMTERYTRLDATKVYSSGRTTFSSTTGTSGRWRIQTDNDKLPIVKAVGVLFGPG